MSPSTAIRLYKGTELAKLGAMWRAGAYEFSKSSKRKLEKTRTSDETGCSNASGTGRGCTLRGYKPFVRLLRELIEVTDIFEGCLEVEFVVGCDNGNVLAV